MGRPRHLLKRGGRFYFNIKVPKDLRPLYGDAEVIRQALKTSDRAEAEREVYFRGHKQHEEFIAKRRELGERKRAAIPARRIEVSEREAHDIVCRFFINLEKRSEQWWLSEGQRLSAEAKAEIAENLGVDATVYAGGNESYVGNDSTEEFDAFLEADGIDVPKNTAAYDKLMGLFRAARLENLNRTLDRVRNRNVTEHEPRLRGIYAHTPAPVSNARVSVSELVTRFLKSRENKSEVTLRTYRTPCRVLQEVLGENTSVDAVTQDDIERLFNILRHVPKNATKKYKGKTLEAIVAATGDDEAVEKLSAKAMENYYTNINAIFNFAVDRGLMEKNPARGKWLRDAFLTETDDVPKVLFTVEELNRLFRSPLYVGCRDDEDGYSTPGSFKERRGRFWIPLLALFHGFRCNEVCQLYVEDCKVEDGVPYLEIRKEREDGSRCEKRLKTKQSKRRVPIHRTLIELGFLKYIAERRNDPEHLRLFPELTLGKTGYYSDPFSKWFGRFVKSVLGGGCEASFHSFRHLFRTALEEASVSISDAERLGGWQVGERSEERRYAHGSTMRKLFGEICKVKFDGLDLHHLQRNPRCLHPGAKSGEPTSTIAC